MGFEQTRKTCGKDYVRKRGSSGWRCCGRLLEMDLVLPSISFKPRMYACQWSRIPDTQAYSNMCYPCENKLTLFIWRGSLESQISDNEN